MKVEPQQEHRWLEKLVGEWTSEAEANMGDDAPAVKFTSSETVRSVGGVWIVCEAVGEVPGGETTTTIMTLGYDPVRKRYAGTFFGSMMTHLWIYDGEVDAAGKVLSLETEGPSFVAEGKMAKYRDTMEIVSDDHRILSSRVLTEEGQWHHFMTAHYRRKK